MYAHPFMNKELNYSQTIKKTFDYALKMFHVCLSGRVSEDPVSRSLNDSYQERLFP